MASYKDPNPVGSGSFPVSSFNPKYFLKAPPAKAAALGVRAAMAGFWREANIQPTDGGVKGGWVKDRQIGSPASLIPSLAQQAFL